MGKICAYNLVIFEVSHKASNAFKCLTFKLVSDLFYLTLGFQGSSKILPMTQVYPYFGGSSAPCKIHLFLVHPSVDGQLNLLTRWTSPALGHVSSLARPCACGFTTAFHVLTKPKRKKSKQQGCRAGCVLQADS